MTPWHPMLVKILRPVSTAPLRPAWIHSPAETGDRARRKRAPPLPSRWRDRLHVLARVDEVFRIARLLPGAAEFFVAGIVLR